MLCVICKKEYDGHYNSKSCSIECKKKIRSKINEKYYSKKRVEKYNSIKDLENEVWKDIKGYEGLYKISNLGRIKSMYRRGGGGILKPNLAKNGYYTIGLRLKNKGIKRFLIHRLLALHFIDNPNNLPMVDHINRKRNDNRLENLHWVSVKENCLNSNRVYFSSSLEYTKEYNKTYNKYYYGFRACVNKKSKRSKSLIKCVCWIFENNKYLMNHIISPKILPAPV